MRTKDNKCTESNQDTGVAKEDTGETNEGRAHSQKVGTTK